MSLRPCTEHGCPNLTDRGKCAVHRREARRASDRRRPTADQRGYGSEWRRTRAAFLRSYPVCELCSAPSTEVDHRDGRGPLGPHGHDWGQPARAVQAVSLKTDGERPAWRVESAVAPVRPGDVVIVRLKDVGWGSTSEPKGRSLGMYCPPQGVDRTSSLPEDCTALTGFRRAVSV